MLLLAGSLRGCQVTFSPHLGQVSGSASAAKAVTAPTRHSAAISRKNETFWATFYPIMTFLLGAGTYIAVFFGGNDVLKGEMSFVGTRPEAPKYVDAYTDEMMATLLLPAGITSTASIAYKDEDKVLSEFIDKGMSVDEAYIEKVLPEKMKYNLDYIRNFSFFGDIKICFKTVF